MLLSAHATSGLNRGALSGIKSCGYVLYTPDTSAIFILWGFLVKCRHDIIAFCTVEQAEAGYHDIRFLFKICFHLPFIYYICSFLICQLYAIFSFFTAGRWKHYLSLEDLFDFSRQQHSSFPLSHLRTETPSRPKGSCFIYMLAFIAEMSLFSSSQRYFTTVLEVLVNVCEFRVCVFTLA